MIDLIIIAIILCVVCAVAVYLLKAKRRGKCVGCPYAKQCGGKACGKTKTDEKE